MGLILKEKQEEKKLLLRDLIPGDIGFFNDDKEEPFIITDESGLVYLNSGFVIDCNFYEEINDCENPVTLLPPGTTFIIEE